MEYPGTPSYSVRGARKIERDKAIPKGWGIVRTGTHYNHIKRLNELRDIKGGTKEMWLRQHKEEVIEYYDGNGAEATKSRFILSSETLDAVIGGGRRKPFIKPYNKVDKLEILIEQYRCDVQDLKKEYAELKEAFASFHTQVAGQITDKFLIPLLQAGIKIDDSLAIKSHKDPLALDGKLVTKKVVAKGGNNE